MTTTRPPAFVRSRCSRAAILSASAYAPEPSSAWRSMSDPPAGPRLCSRRRSLALKTPLPAAAANIYLTYIDGRIAAMVTVEIPVQWGDMDAFGHVNNTVYFRWFESARIAYFEKIGLNERMRRDRKGPILA